MRNKNLFLPKMLKPPVLKNQTMCPFTVALCPSANPLVVPNIKKESYTGLFLFYKFIAILISLFFRLEQVWHMLLLLLLLAGHTAQYLPLSYC